MFRWFNDLRVSRKLYLMTGVFIAGLLAFVVMAKSTIDAVKINGTAYLEIEDDKDLVADALDGVGEGDGPAGASRARDWDVVAGSAEGSAIHGGDACVGRRGGALAIAFRRGLAAGAAGQGEDQRRGKEGSGQGSHGARFPSS